MKKKLCLYLCIAQSIIILGVVLAIVLSSSIIKASQKVDLVEYLSQFSEENNYLPNAGYIPDAETAGAVGSAIIDKMTGKQHRRLLYQLSTTVEYDQENRLWLIEKGYLFSRGGFVIIEQDSGKVVKALLFK